MPRRSVASSSGPQGTTASGSAARKPTTSQWRVRFRYDTYDDLTFQDAVPSDPSAHPKATEEGIPLPVPPNVSSFAKSLELDSAFQSAGSRTAPDRLSTIIYQVSDTFSRDPDNQAIVTRGLPIHRIEEGGTRGLDVEVLAIIPPPPPVTSKTTREQRDKM